VHEITQYAAGAFAEPRTLAALGGLGRRIAMDDPRQVRQTAVELTAELFFAPLLKEMREFPIGRELMPGGQMHSAFAENLDRRLAEAVAQRDPGGLVQELVRTLQARSSADWPTNLALRPDAGATEAAGPEREPQVAGSME
jgi:Rod binding domain-containing protein